MTYKLSRRTVVGGLAGSMALNFRAFGQTLTMPTSPVTLNFVDVAGNLALTQKAIEAYRDKNPKLVAKVNFSKAPAPELPGKIKAQQDAGRVDIDLVLTGTDALSAGIDQKLWIPMVTDYAAELPKLEDIYLPGAAKMQGLAANQGVCMVFCPAGPIIEYMPDAVKQAPKTAQELLDWAKANPKRFIYARPANSGPGRTFLQGLPYILGDKDPMDPKNGWDKTWAYLVELGKYIEYYPTGTGPTMKELGEGSRDMIASQIGWDINPRILGVVPKEAKVGTLKGFHWVTDAQYLCIPKGVSNDKLAVLLDITNYMLSQAGAGDDLRQGLFLSRPRGEGRAAVDGAGGEPEGDRGIQARRLRQGDHRGSAGGAAAAGQAGLCVPALGPADRREKEEVAYGAKMKAGDSRRQSSLSSLRRPASPGKERLHGDRRTRFPRAAARRNEPRLRHRARAQGRHADGQAGRVRRPARPVRLRQVDRAQLPRRAAAADRAAASGSTRRASTRWRRKSAASAWCSRTTRCSRT